MVHAINVVSTDQRPPSNSFIPSTDVIAPTPTGIRVNDSNRRRARFYIYCKSQCDSVKPGKLRVRCGTCKDEAFELNAGPNSWDDVLNTNRIRGMSCHDALSLSIRKTHFYVNIIDCLEQDLKT